MAIGKEEKKEQRNNQYNNVPVPLTVTGTLAKGVERIKYSERKNDHYVSIPFNVMDARSSEGEEVISRTDSSFVTLTFWKSDFSEETWEAITNYVENQTLKVTGRFGKPPFERFMTVKEIHEEPDLFFN